MPSTTRLALNKPQGTDVVNVTTALINQYNTLDTNWEAFVCTSATRPGSPFTGMLIYETDTGQMYRYEAGWNFITWARRPRGFITSDFKTSSSTIVNNSEGPQDMRLTGNYFTGRQYVIHGFGRVDTAAAFPTSTAAQIRWRIANGVETVSSANTLVSGLIIDIVEAAQGSWFDTQWSQLFTLDALGFPSGQYTIANLLQTGTAVNIQFNGGRHMWIEDIGAIV